MEAEEKHKNYAYKTDVVSLSNGEAEIRIYGGVGYGWDETSSESFASDVEFLISYMGVKKITVRINCPGGSVVQGLGICSTILKTNASGEAKINTCNDGVAASMGAVILVCGDKVMGQDFSSVMIHNPYVQDKDYDDLEENHKKFVDTMRESTLSILEKRTNKTREELQAMMAEETWLSATEALEAGFIDEIIDTTKTRATPIQTPQAKKVREVYAFYKEALRTIEKPQAQSIEPVATPQAGEQNPLPTPQKNEPQGKQNNQPKNTGNAMDLRTAIIATLSLPADATDIDITNAIKQNVSLGMQGESFKLKAEGLEFENEELKKQVEATKNAQAIALVDGAIASNKIRADRRDYFVKMALHDYASTAEHIRSLSSHPHLADKARSVNERAEWKWDDWQKKDPEGLAKLKQNDSVVYSQLFEEKYKIKPQF